MLSHPGKDLLGNTTPEHKKLFKILYAIIKEAGNAFDILYATPPRNLQVFFNHIYSICSGLIAHPVLVPTVLTTSFLGTIPPVVRIFLEQENNNLQQMLDNLASEIGYEPPNDEELEKEFNAFLRKKGIYHLTAKVIRKKTHRLKNGFHEKEELALKLTYHSSIKDFFDKSYEENKNKNILGLADLLSPKLIKKILQNLKKNVAENLEENKKTLLNEILSNKENVLDIVYNKNKNDFNEEEQKRVLLLTQLYGFFVVKKDGADTFDDAITLDQSRKQFIEKFNKLDAATIAQNIYGLINDTNFNFWLAFYVTDYLTNQWDTGKWDPHVLLAVLGSMLAITAVQLGLRSVHYFSNKTDADEHKLPHYISNKPLTHQLIEEFFLKQVITAREKAIPENRLEQNVNRQAEVQRILNGSVKPIKPTKTQQQFDLLREEANLNKKKLVIHTANHLGTQIIYIAFLAWVAGVVVGAADAINKVFGKYLAKINIGMGFTLGAAAVVSGFLLSNPGALVFAGIGLLVGIGFAIYSHFQEKAKRNILNKQLEKNNEKITSLEKLEKENKGLRDLIKKENLTPLTTLKPNDDRGFRRTTTKKGGVWTTIKKGLTRAFLGLARVETGILLIRLTLLPAIAVIMKLIVLPTLVAAVLTGPVGWIAAIAVGAVWAAMNIYLYHRESKLKAAQRTLNDIDNRIEAAKANQANYLAQLEYNGPKQPPSSDSMVYQLLSDNRTSNPSKNDSRGSASVPPLGKFGGPLQPNPLSDEQTAIPTPFLSMPGLKN